MKKNYVLISGLNLDSSNRGTAILGYGAVAFLHLYGYFNENYELLSFKYVKKLFAYEEKYKDVNINGINFKIKIVSVSSYERLLFDKSNYICWCTRWGKLIKQIKLVAAINGGDGFSDIYGRGSFLYRLCEVKFAILKDIPVVFLPQTIGPFKDKKNKNFGLEILKKIETLYVRDEEFVDELNAEGIKWNLSKDLSYYVSPEKYDFVIEKKAIGINISGLCYFNEFKDLKGHFNSYKKLINNIIEYFRDKGISVYLIPHSYNYYTPLKDEDDLEACKEVYNNLTNKSNIVVVDKNLSPQQLKYIISKMSFFVGTRMHSNFAAMFTNVPFFCLAYSYKFVGALNSNGFEGDKRVAMIKDLDVTEIDGVLKKIIECYE